MSANGCHCASCKSERRTAAFAKQATDLMHQQMSASFLFGGRGSIFNVVAPRRSIVAVLKTACGCTKRVSLPEPLESYHMELAVGLDMVSMKAPSPNATIEVKKRIFVRNRQIGDYEWEYIEDVPSQTKTERQLRERCDNHWSALVNKQVEFAKSEKEVSRLRKVVQYYQDLVRDMKKVLNG